ncbi:MULTISPECIES: sigma-70 family RNA polymerase sigma factor [Sediminibacillus]|uniref:sigma-70 family RNA polymerase sigma factor n=1 Tax=Sediminibacillus TaxID=482460 RepID=UPI0004111FE4|nr:sigma-70 family RNA polymerase sigma factor [Sediminibacillus terrae]
MDIQELYELYIHDVYRYLLSLCKDKNLAEDLTQDTFMKAYAALETGPPNHLKAWLMKIAYHNFVDFVRRNKKVTYEEPEYFSYLSQEDSTEWQVQKKLEKEELHNKLAQLKPMQKHAILLCDIQGYSYKEAAEMLSVKVNTLKTHIFRGRGRLRQLYANRSAEE